MRLNEQISTAQQHLREASEFVFPDDKVGQFLILCEEAAICYSQSKFDKAIVSYERAIELMEETGNDSGLEFVEAIVGLAMSYFSCHRDAPVEALLVTALGIMRRILGPRSFESASVLHKLAGVYKQQGRFVEAGVLLTGVESIQGKAHLMDPLIDSSNNFEAGLTYQMDGHHVRALNRYQRALQAFEHLDAGKSHEVIAIHIRMYEIYLSMGDERRAENHYQTATNLLDTTFGYQQPNSFRSAMALARAFAVQDKDELSESFYFYAIETSRREAAPAPGLEACEEYAALLERAGRPEDAKLLRRRARGLVRPFNRR